VGNINQSFPLPQRKKDFQNVGNAQTPIRREDNTWYETKKGKQVARHGLHKGKKRS
jgi:hypothetical protein